MFSFFYKYMELKENNDENIILNMITQLIKNNYIQTNVCLSLLKKKREKHSY